MSVKMFDQGETEVGSLAFHRQMLLIHGISISGIPVFETTNRRLDNIEVRRYREVLCILSDNNLLPNSYKLRVRLTQPSDTPYSIENGWLLVQGKISTLRFKIINTGLAERWSGFYSPHLHDDKGDSLWVIRLNPKQTGKCPGNCSFSFVSVYNLCRPHRRSKHDSS